MNYPPSRLVRVAAAVGVLAASIGAPRRYRIPR